MKDEILDIAKTYDDLFKNQPKSLTELLSSGHHDAVELTYAIRNFRKRGGDKATNKKCEYRLLWAFWQNLPDWRIGYRYKLTVSDRGGDLTDWENIRPLVDEGIMDHDLLEEDKKRIEESPMYDMFADPAAPEPVAIEKPMPPQPERAAKKSRYETATEQHDVGLEMVNIETKMLDFRWENNGVEHMFAEAKTNPVLRTRQDKFVVFNGRCVHVDIKTAKWAWDCSIATEMLLEAVRVNGVFFIVFAVDSAKPYFGAIYAKDVFKKIIRVELRPKPGWHANEYEDMKKKLEIQFSHVPIKELPYSPKLSNDPLVLVSRSWTTPLVKFLREELGVNWRSEKKGLQA
jgi:hypothetical protein